MSLPIAYIWKNQATIELINTGLQLGNTFFEVFSLIFFFSAESLGAFDSADNSEGADVSESKRDDSSLTKLLVRKWEGKNEFQSPSVSGLVDPKT